MFVIFVVELKAGFCKWWNTNKKRPAFHVVFDKLINKTKIGYKIKKQYAFKLAYSTQKPMQRTGFLFQLSY